MIGLFVRHPNAANLLMAAMLVVGVFAILNLTTRFWPPANLNQVEVSISWPGASAEDVADGILDAVEPQVRFLPDVDDVVSYAREGSAFTSVNFEAGTDMQQALSRVEQAIDSITTLPEDSETPSITFDEMFDPVAKIGISGPFPETSLQLFAKRVRDDLLDRGLEKVTLRGLRTRELIVEAREHDLLRLGLTPQDIAAAIRRNTDDRPSGVLDGVVDQQIRVLAVEETVASIANIEVQTLPNGDVLRVGDVANVIDGFARSSVSGQRGGNPAVELSIERAQSDDALQSDRIVREYLEEARQTLPRSLNLQLYDVRTETLWERISILIKNGGQGLAVVLLVLFIFLDARIAFWVAVGIPVAFAGTLAAMFVTGQSVNMISLFALIMMLGVIVDDAIVVGEHTATLTERGVPPVEAARRGAEEMLMPVMASSITTIAAFGPLFMMRDVMGQMFSAIPLVAIAIIIASVIECFLILPGHLAHAWGKPSGLNVGRFFRLTLWAGLGATLIGGVFTLAKRVIDNPETAQVLSDLPLSLVAVVAILLGLAGAATLNESRAR
ncbi:MAG: efflux RND transporter permease subunit, partial [Pseudomonadota bacterium]